MAIPFQELSGSPEEFFGPDGMRAQRRILVPYNQRYVMITRLLGNNAVIGSGGVGAAEFPNTIDGGSISQVVVKQARITPWPAAGDNEPSFTDIEEEMITYTDAAAPNRRYAKIVIDYELAEWSGGLPSPVPFEEGTYLTYRQDFATEYMDLPQRHLQWFSGAVDANSDVIAVPPDAVPMIRIPSTEHHITWHRVLDPPWRAIKELRGRINSEDWPTSVANGGWAAGTLLFEGAQTETNMVGFSSGVPLFTHTISYLFRERTIEMTKVNGVWRAFGWNNTFRSLPADDAAWDVLVDKATGKGLYEETPFSTGFNDLFVFAATA